MLLEDKAGYRVMEEAWLDSMGREGWSETVTFKQRAKK